MHKMIEALHVKKMVKRYVCDVVKCSDLPVVFVVECTVWTLLGDTAL